MDVQRAVCLPFKWKMGMEGRLCVWREIRLVYQTGGEVRVLWYLMRNFKMAGIDVELGWELGRGGSYFDSIC